MKQLPYNTGKVQIGCRYTPPPPRYYVSYDEDRLQRALLGVRKEVPRDYWITLAAIIAFLVLGSVMVAQ